MYVQVVFDGWTESGPSSVIVQDLDNESGASGNQTEKQERYRA